MPFEVLETQPGDIKVPMASISYEVPKRAGRNTPPRLIVSIPTTIAGVCKHERFVFELGTGSDGGKARISGVAKAVPGSAPGRMLMHAIVIRFGEVKALGEDAAAKESVPVRKISDTVWEIDLPPWFKVSSSAKPKTSKAA
jgi:hypothetical protein